MGFQVAYDCFFRQFRSKLDLNINYQFTSFGVQKTDQGVDQKCIVSSFFIGPLNRWQKLYMYKALPFI